MKIYALIILALMVLCETVAFTAFDYPKVKSWWIANVILFICNLLCVFMVENTKEAVPDKWKVYVPALFLLALIILVVLPQAQTFNQ